MLQNQKEASATRVFSSFLAHNGNLYILIVRLTWDQAQV